MFKQEENSFCKNVTYDDIRENAYTLIVNKYIPDEADEQYHNKLINTLTKKFNTIFEIQRPIAFAKLKQVGFEKIHECA